MMWKFKEGSDDQINEFVTGLRGLVGKIDVLRSLEVGVNVNPNETFSCALICEFDNLEDLQKYATDPRHVAVASIAKGISLQRVAVDFEE